MTVSTTCAAAPWPCPMPPRMTLPPPQRSHSRARSRPTTRYHRVAHDRRSSDRTSRHRRAGRYSSRERPHYASLKAIHDALAVQGDELDLALLAGLEAHRRTGGNVEPEATRARALELQRAIGLEEVIVRADLNRPIARIGHRDPARLAPRVQR